MTWHDLNKQVEVSIALLLYNITSKIENMLINLFKDEFLFEH